MYLNINPREKLQRARLRYLVDHNGVDKESSRGRRTADSKATPISSPEPSWKHYQGVQRMICSGVTVLKY